MEIYSSNNNYRNIINKNFYLILIFIIIIFLIFIIVFWDKQIFTKNMKNLKIKIVKEKTLEIVDINENYVSQKISENRVNRGLNNCGIIFIDKYVVKCVGISDEPDETNQDEFIIYTENKNKDLDGLFIKNYLWKNGKLFNYIKINNYKNSNNTKYAKCIIIEKLDDDLTNYILRYSYYNAFGNFDDYTFFYDRLPKTNGLLINDHVNPYDSEYTKKQKLHNIKKNDEIKKKIKKYIFKICYELNIDLIFLHHNLLKKGWNYRDLKIDNIGYKIVNEKLQLIFIDEDLGLYNIIKDRGINIHYSNYLNNNFIKYSLGNYFILGQNFLFYLFDIDFSNFYPKFDSEQIITKLKFSNKIIDEINNEFQWIKIIPNNKNIFFVIQFIMGFYRLVFFDNHAKHMSDPLFNNSSIAIDELFNSMESINKLLKDIF